MSLDAIIRIVAAVAAVGLLAGPAVAVLAREAKTRWQKNPMEAGTEKAAAVTAKDLHIVLDLATRLKAAQCMEGVALCQQLLDVMLGNSKARK